MIEEFRKRTREKESFSARVPPFKGKVSRSWEKEGGKSTMSLRIGVNYRPGENKLKLWWLRCRVRNNTATTRSNYREPTIIPGHPVTLERRITMQQLSSR